MRSIGSISGILSRFITYLTYEPNLERKIRTGSPIGPGSPLAPFSPCNVKKNDPVKIGLLYVVTIRFSSSFIL